MPIQLSGICIYLDKMEKSLLHKISPTEAESNDT